MIEIKISVSDVNYDEALEVLLPVLLNYLSKSPKLAQSPLIASVLPKLNSSGVAAAKLLLKALPQDARDELAVVCLNQYKDSIPELLTREAAKRKIEMAITSVEIRNLQENAE